MAKRCLTAIQIDGVYHALLQLSDCSSVTGNPSDSLSSSLISNLGTNLIQGVFNNQFTQSQVEKTVQSATGTSMILALSSGGGVNRNVIKMRVFRRDFEGGLGWESGSVTQVSLHWGVIIDDDTKKGYLVEAIKIGNTVYTSQQGYDHTEPIYQAFTNGVCEIAGGGGATHIAKRTGVLKGLSSYLSDVLAVSGGGGGGMLIGTTQYTGKEAGGISGSGDNSANQSTGYGFGQGESSVAYSGGGAGLYGGYKGTSEKSGGAGSGYIGNSLLSNKKMVGFNVPTSSSADTKTESTNEYSESGSVGLPKAGNGKARIKFLADIVNKEIEEIAKNYNDFSNLLNYRGYSLVPIVDYLGTDKLLFLTGLGTQYSASALSYSNGQYTFTITNRDEFMLYIPLKKRYRVVHVNCDVKMPSNEDRYYTAAIILVDSNLVVQGQSVNGSVFSRGYEKTGGSYYTSYTPISDGDWHTLSFDCDCIIDYIRLNVSIFNGLFKNLELTVVDT